MLWLRLNPWTPPPVVRIRRPPRRFPCTRHPFSSEAPGRGGVPARRGRRKRHPGHTPRHCLPFPFVSSSSSSFCLLRFPAVVPFAYSAPGFGSRSRFSEPFARLFDQVQVSENRFGLSLRSGAAPAAFVRSGRPRIHSPPPCPAPAPAEFRSSSDGRISAVRDHRFTIRFRPPVPLVCCSFRSWFVSPVRFAQFSLLRSDCLVLFNSAQFSSARFYRFLFRFCILW